MSSLLLAGCGAGTGNGGGNLASGSFKVELSSGTQTMLAPIEDHTLGLTAQTRQQVSKQLQALGLPPLSSSAQTISGVNFYVSVLTSEGQVLGQSRDVQPSFSGPKGQYEKVNTYDGRAAWDYFTYSSQGSGEYSIHARGSTSSTKATTTVDVSNRMATPAPPSVSKFDTSAHISTQSVTGAKSYFAAITDQNGNILKKGVTASSYSPTLFLSQSDGADLSRLENYYLVQIAFSWDVTANPTRPLSGRPDKMNSSVLITPLLWSRFESISAPSLVLGNSNNANQLVHFQNTGNLPLSYTVTTDASWLKVTTSAKGILDTWQKGNVGISASCPSEGTVQRGKLNITTNDPFKPVFNYDVTVDCTPPPTLSTSWETANEGGYTQSPTVSFSSTGDRVATTLDSYSSQYRVLSTIDGRTLKSVALPYGTYIQNLKWRPQSNQIAISTSSSSVNLLDADTGSTLRQFTFEQSGSTSALAFSSDGKKLVAGAGTSLNVWDADSGAYLLSKSFPYYHQSIREIAVSPDGQQIAVSFDAFSRPFSQSTVILDAQTGNELARLQFDTDQLTYSPPRLAWSPDGSKLAVALTTGYPSHVGWLGVWEANSGNRIWLQSGLPAINNLGWSGDGSYLAGHHTVSSPSYTEVVTLWSAGTGAQAYQYKADPTTSAAVKGFAWAPHDAKMVVVLDSGKYRLISFQR